MCERRFWSSFRAAATLLMGGTLLLPVPPAWAQSSQLVPLVTDQTPLALPATFGMPAAVVTNDAGDVALLGRGGTAAFFRRAGTGTFVRVLQAGDELPGLPGSRATSINPTLMLNASGLMAFSVDFFPDSSAGAQGIVLTFDGTTLRNVVDGLDPIPGAAGVTFGRQIAFALNDSGHVMVSAMGVVCISLAGAPVVRVAGAGDVAPGTGGLISQVRRSRVNHQDGVLIAADVSGGAATSAAFKWTAGGGLVKMVAQGESAPVGGPFGLVDGLALNDLGDVLFISNGAYWRQTAAGVITRAIGTGDPVPVIGGTLSGVSTAALFNNNGDIGFTAAVGGSPTSAFGLFRAVGTGGLEVAAYRTQVAPGTAATFNTFAGLSMNASGAIAFRGVLANGAPIGVYVQSGAALPDPVALDGLPTPLGGTYVFATTVSTQTQVLASGAVLFGADILNGSTEHAQILGTPTTSSIVISTADALPDTGRTILAARTFGVGAAGDFVAFLAQYPGGGYSLVRHHIANAQTAVVASEGNVMPATGGRLRLSNVSVAFVGATGDVVFAARLFGGALTARSAIFSATPSAILKIVADGDTDSDSRVLDGVTLSGSLAPSPVNAAGQVVFSVARVGGGSLAGLYLGSAGVPPVKIVEVGDAVDGARPGEVVNAISASGLPGDRMINDLGALAFFAQTRAPLLPGQPSSAAFRTGLLISSGGTTAKIAHVGDAVPGGVGTFADFATPAFNSSGELAFVATVTGGPSGIFLYSPLPSPALTPFVLHGDAAPGGGFFSFTLPLRPDVVMNNQRDVLFLADLTGGPSDSGYFIRRGPVGSLQRLVGQGDPAPGTAGVFSTLQHTLNSTISEFSQLGDLGDVSFRGSSPGAGGINSGLWHVKTDNTVQELVVRGTVAPEFGGGAAVLTSQISQWASGGRYPTFVRVTGGTFVDGIFLFVPVIGVDTPPGSDVVVVPTDATSNQTPVSMTFENVVQAGETSVVTSAGGPTVPDGFALGSPPTYVNITTTAVFAGDITVCVNIETLGFPPGATLRLLHFENGVWEDVTTSGPTGGIICGSVTSLSPFAVASLTDTEAPVVTVIMTPNMIWPPNGEFVTATAQIQISDNSDPAPQVELVSITSNEAIDGDVSGATFGTDDRTFLLRAKRDSGGAGRVYTVTYRVTDSAGNTTIASGTVVVPHDRGRR